MYKIPPGGGGGSIASLRPMMSSCEVVTFPSVSWVGYGEWCLIVSIPDLCPFSYSAQDNRHKFIYNLGNPKMILKLIFYFSFQDEGLA